MTNSEPLLQVVTTSFDSYVIKSDGKYSGVCIDILESLSRDVGFKYNLTERTDGVFGICNDGKWNGMVEDIVDGDMDLAVQTFSWTEDRSEAVDYLPPFQAGAMVSTILWESETLLFQFLKPFDTGECHCQADHVKK
jgi:hypothetical protein